MVTMARLCLKQAMALTIHSSQVLAYSTTWNKPTAGTIVITSINCYDKLRKLKPKEPSRAFVMFISKARKN
jgi:hypothetical protein